MDMRKISELKILSYFDLHPLSDLRKRQNLRTSIAVVGNGGLLTEQDQEAIENANQVIRFNNYATRSEILDHTKKKYHCDILFTTMDLHSKGASPDTVVIGIPFPFKAEQICRKMDLWYQDSNIRTVNPYLCMQMNKELEIPGLGYQHPHPSIGFTCLWMLNQLINKLDAVYVCGFEWYYNDSDGTIQGHDMASEKYPTNWNHNYPKEIRWIIKNLYQKETPFRFGDRQRHIMDRVARRINGQTNS